MSRNFMGTLILFCMLLQAAVAKECKCLEEWSQADYDPRCVNQQGCTDCAEDGAWCIAEDADCDEIFRNHETGASGNWFHCDLRTQRPGAAAVGGRDMCTEGHLDRQGETSEDQCTSISGCCYDSATNHCGKCIYDDTCKDDNAALAELRPWSTLNCHASALINLCAQHLTWTQNVAHVCRLSCGICIPTAPIASTGGNSTAGFLEAFLDIVIEGLNDDNSHHVVEAVVKAVINEFNTDRFVVDVLKGQSALRVKFYAESNASQITSHMFDAVKQASLAGSILAEFFVAEPSIELNSVSIKPRDGTSDSKGVQVNSVIITSILVFMFFLL